MAEKQVVPDDIFNDAYEKCAQKDRPFYIAGAINERAKGVWTDEDIRRAFEAGIRHKAGRGPFVVKWLAEYKENRNNIS